MKKRLAPLATGMICLTAAVLTSLPANARMGTSRTNPPPPPPPLTVDNKMFEVSTDPNIGQVGYANQPIIFTRSYIDGASSTLTTAGGQFTYEVQTGQSEEHSGMLFGINKSVMKGDIQIPTDAKIKIALVPGGEIVPMATDPAYVIWKAEYSIDRGSGPEDYSADIAYNAATYSFGSIQIRRNTTALPEQFGRPSSLAYDGTYDPPGAVPRAVFRLKSLVSYEKNSDPPIPVLGWDDDPVNGVVYIEPGKSFTLTLNQVRNRLAK